MDDHGTPDSPDSPGPAGPPGEDSRPVLRVLTPDATPEEVAAIVAVLAALGGAPEPVRRRPRPAWSDPRRLVRAVHPAGRGGWRASGLPR